MLGKLDLPTCFSIECQGGSELLEETLAWAEIFQATIKSEAMFVFAIHPIMDLIPQCN